jgi:ATP-binding cassette subfamily C exporter for protease/lipase
MKVPAFFLRSDLGRSLWTFRREFAWVGVFSFFANLLMLTPTLYMLQVFDRVMLSQNEFTLIALTLVTVLFFTIMAFAEWVRSRLMVRAGVRFDDFLNSRVFDASFSAGMAHGARNTMQSFTDLTSLRQFLTGPGTFAFFDLPWTPIYLLVLFLMHPVLGWTSIAFVIFLGAFAWAGQRMTARRQELAMEGVMQSNAYLGAKLRNAETVQAMGMLGSLRDKWIGLYEGQLLNQSNALASQQQLAAMTKFIQYTQQSVILAIGALLVIRGEMSVGAMIASNALMANSLRPISTLSSTWKQFVEARKGYLRLEQLLGDHPQREELHVADKVDGQLTLVNLVATAPGRPEPILKTLNATFNPGEVVAIVGPSGAGSDAEGPAGGRRERFMVRSWPGSWGRSGRCCRFRGPAPGRPWKEGSSGAPP